MPKKTNDELDKLKQEITNLKTGHLRALADYQNLQKRHQEEKQISAKYAAADLLTELLPTLDDLNRAQKHLNDPGLKLVIDQLNKTLNSQGLTQIPTTNELFDPLLMDCLEVVPGPKDQVITTITPGYLYFDKVLRPAKVTVGAGEKK